MKLGIFLGILAGAMSYQLDSCGSTQPSEPMLGISVTDNPSTARTMEKSTASAQPTGGSTVNAEHVYVTVSNISAYGVLGDGSEGWQEVSDQVQTIDLIALSGGAIDQLGLAALPAGDYSQVRLVITESSVVVDGTEYPMTIPSGSSSGLKIQGEFTLEAGITTSVLLDFDASSSVTYNKGKGYMLTPVVSILSVSYSAPPSEPPGGDDDATGASSPSPAPEASPSPEPEASPSPAPVPEASPSPEPEASPSPVPEVSPSPAPEASPSPGPEVSPTPSSSPAPAP